jgi:hypothetical protein
MHRIWVLFAHKILSAMQAQPVSKTRLIIPRFATMVSTAISITAVPASHWLANRVQTPQHVIPEFVLMVSAEWYLEACHVRQLTQPVSVKMGCVRPYIIYRTAAHITATV